MFSKNCNTRCHTEKCCQMLFQFCDHICRNFLSMLPFVRKKHKTESDGPAYGIRWVSERTEANFVSGTADAAFEVIGRKRL